MADWPGSRTTYQRRRWYYLRCRGRACWPASRHIDFVGRGPLAFASALAAAAPQASYKPVCAAPTSLRLCTAHQELPIDARARPPQETISSKRLRLKRKPPDKIGTCQRSKGIDYTQLLKEYEHLVHAGNLEWQRYALPAAGHGTEPEFGPTYNTRNTVTWCQPLSAWRDTSHLNITPWALKQQLHAKQQWASVMRLLQHRASASMDRVYILEEGYIPPAAAVGRSVAIGDQWSSSVAIGDMWSRSMEQQHNAYM
eukprot:XP_001697871.1 hypothetical protein CHLREDRAFT_193090 [Chlamydomonas reinhardtii]